MNKVNDDENIYDIIKSEIMIYLDDIITEHIIKNRTKKRVMFADIVRVMIIPNREYYANEKLYEEIWWKHFDYQIFRQIEVMNLSNYIRSHPGANMKQFNDAMMNYVENS